jgi:hypothetical protein
LNQGFQSASPGDSLHRYSIFFTDIHFRKSNLLTAFWSILSSVPTFFECISVNHSFKKPPRDCQPWPSAYLSWSATWIWHH